MKGLIKQMRNKKGFTLIELLVVIAIIGLLSTLAVVSLNGARAKARDAKRLSDLKGIQTAIEIFKVNSEGVPPSPTNNWTLGLDEAFPNGLPTSPSGAGYWYCAVLGTTNKYLLGATLEGTNGTGIDDADAAWLTGNVCTQEGAALGVGPVCASAGDPEIFCIGDTGA